MPHDEKDEGEVDNWFAEPAPLHEDGPSWREQGPEAELDDWLHGPEPSPARRAASVEKRRLAAVVAILGVCLLIGLAVGGVFSGQSKPVSAPAPVVATEALTASTSTPFTPPPLRPASGPTLKRGAHGQRVVVLQRALAQLGYYSGRIDGQYGPGTESAVSRFQTASGLTPDGIFGNLTRRALRRALAG